jgi:hypothetical protein
VSANSLVSAKPWCQQSSPVTLALQCLLLGTCISPRRASISLTFFSRHTCSPCSPFSRVSAFLVSAIFSYQRTSGSPVTFPLLLPFSPPFLSYICRPKFRDLSSSDLGTHSDAEHFSYKNISCARNPLLPERIIHGHHVFYILRGLNFSCWSFTAMSTSQMVGVEIHPV